MSDRRVSKEELEAFWRGDKDTYQRMYSDRMQQKANEAEKQGKQVTYIPNDGSHELPEVIITAPRETEEQKNFRLKQDYENLADKALTVASFVPGLDTYADAIDTFNQFKHGNYGQGLVGLGSVVIPGISLPILRKGFNYIKDNIRITLPKAEYYRVLSDLDVSKSSEAVQDLINSGIVRSNPKGTYKHDGSREEYIGPYFYKGEPFRPALNRSSKVLISSSKNLDWLPIDTHETILRKYPGSSQFTPLYNGVPNTAPTKEFQLWERGNNFITNKLWFRKNLPNKEINVKPFNYPERYNIVVHTDYGNNKGTFGSGAYINKLGTLMPGINSNKEIPYIWFNENKPYTMGVNGNPVTRIIVGNKDRISGLTRVRDMKTKVGQWTGSSGFVLPSEMVTSEPQDIKDLLLFEWNNELKRYQLKKKGGKL